ncbi:MAG TPA: succinate dehydrogenase cytochrome b subunit [Mycobacteriales bacterium]|jgi:succinate dehydrogenase / fumarate reductase cytochrome b subunit|nr:succinate dehydrogenase cytochrome b subunit [Mycobacteriales bacterium]
MASAIATGYRSSIGKKAVMAASGGVLVLFLIGHLIGNLKIFFGAATFNHYSAWLRNLGEPALPHRVVLTLIEIALTVSVIAHIWSAILLAQQAHHARPIGYQHRARVQQSYSSRTMRWGGPIIALFVVYHLLDLTFGVANPAGSAASPYTKVIAGFQHWWITVIYVLAVLLVGVHLRHGIWSAAATLGFNKNGRERGLNTLAVTVATLITVGFVIVPLCVLIGLVN